jgi:hypothetical protein
MSSIGGSNIVTTGLVLALDAANRRSYVSGSSVWNDLSGNRYTGSLVNEPVFDSSNAGAIVLDGIDDYISTIPLSLISFSNITIQLWIYPTNIGTGNGYITVFDTPSRHLSLWIGTGYYAIGGANNYYDASSFNWRNNNWYFITMMKSGSIGYVIKNNYESSITLASVGSTFTNQLQFGSNPSAGGTVMKGKYSNISLYNRALTPSEIEQNYEALKSRYIY